MKAKRKMIKSTIFILLLVAILVVVFPTNVQANNPAARGDDYPTDLKNANLDAVVDPWNFYNRECTSFVAWCLNSRNGVAFTNQYRGVKWGNATNWGTAAKSIGITVDSNPAVGSVAWWSDGHVAWVSDVQGTKVTIEEYNYGYNGKYNTRNSSSAGWKTPTGYIHIADISGGGSSGGGGNVSSGFVHLIERGEIYLIVGGAPIYVPSFDPFGGVQPYTDISLEQFNSMPKYPAEGTFVRTTDNGGVYRFVGHAPLYVSSWSHFGGEQPCVNISRQMLDSLPKYIEDGTFIRVNDSTGEVSRIVGGSPMWVTAWSVFGGEYPCTEVSREQRDSLPNYPVKESYIVTMQKGRVYKIVDSYAYYVSDWNFVGGVKSVVYIDEWVLKNKFNYLEKGHVLGKDDITVNDVLELLRFTAGKITLKPEQQEAANITGLPGAKPGINDILEMLRYLAGKPNKLK